jgi:predicted aldo/keto reductase-like oxidoreductase
MNKLNLTRRDFVKAVGIAGAGAMVGSRSALAQAAAPFGGEAKPAKTEATRVPTRALGKTGVRVSMLAQGGIFDITSNQLVLKQALDWGVTYWDTAPSYAGGKSEEGIGMFFEKSPQARREVFLVTKAGAHEPAAMTESLNQSLARMKTDYVDAFFLHGLPGVGALTDDIKAWAEKAKADKKIKFFGFSTHSNMEACLTGAAKLGWVDVIMLAYNYRVMNTDAMKAAVEAAAKAGIGLCAMKTQARRSRGDDQADAKLLDHFEQRGFSAEQAKLKAVWETPQIASVCSAMYTTSVLSSNVAAATDQVKLSGQDRAALAAAASASCAGYCAGCTRFCEGAVANQAPIGDVMRSLMYNHGYGDHAYARETFASLPVEARQRLAITDFSAAERVCPNRLPIASFVGEAMELLA